MSRARQAAAVRGRCSHVADTLPPGPLLDQPLDDLHRRFTLNAVTHLDMVHAFGRRFVASATVVRSYWAVEEKWAR